MGVVGDSAHAFAHPWQRPEWHDNGIARRKQIGGVMRFFKFLLQGAKRLAFAGEFAIQALILSPEEDRRKDKRYSDGS
jgi:hypothetical protein